MNKLYGCIIILKRNGEDGSRYPMLKQSCIIGKYVECDIRLHHQEISSKQLLLEIQPKGLLKITNLNPDIKVYVNKVPVVESVCLKSGETFKIINRQFRWEPAKQVSHIPVKRYSEGRTLKMKNKEASNSLCTKQTINKNKSHIPVFSTKTRKLLGAASKTFSCMPNREFQVTECEEIKPSIKSSESTSLSNFQVSNRSRTRKQKRDFESDSNQENISANFSWESDTPKNTTNIELEALKVQHSTAKKTTVRKSLNDSKVKAKKLFSEENVSELEDTLNLSNSPKKERKSKSIKFVEEKTQNKSEAEIFGTPSKDTFHYSTPLKISKVNAVHSTPIHTEDSILSDDVFKTPKSILKKRNAFSERKKISTKTFNKLLNKSCNEAINLKKSVADYTPTNSLLCSTLNVSTDYNFSNYETPSVSLTNIVSPFSYKENNSSTNKSKSSTKKSTPNFIRDDSINSLHETELSKDGSENILGRKSAQNTSNSTKKDRMSLRKNLANISSVTLDSEQTSIKKTTRSLEQKISESKEDNQSKSSKRKSKVATINLTNVSDVVDLFKSVSEETPDKRVTRRSLEQIMSENKQQNQSNSSKRKSKVARNNMTNVSGMADLFNSVSGETPAKMEQMSENKQENQSKSSKRKSKVATINLTNVSDVVDLVKSVSEETPDKRVTRRSLEQIMSEKNQQNQSNSSKRKSKVARNNMTNVSGVADLFNSVSGETPAKMEQMSENKQENQSKSSKRKSKVATINLTNVSDVVDLVKSVSEETPDKRVTRRSLEQIMSEKNQQNQSNSSKRKSKVAGNNMTDVSGMADLFNSISGETPAKMEQMSENKQENQSKSSKRKSKVATINLTNVSDVVDLFKSVSEETPDKRVTRRSLEQIMSENKQQNQSNSSKRKSKVAGNNMTDVSGMADLFNSISGETPAKMEQMSENKQENQSKSSKRKSKVATINLTNVSDVVDLVKSVSEETPDKRVTRRSLEQIMSENKQQNQSNSSKRKSKVARNNMTNVSGVADLFNSVSGETPAKMEQMSENKQENQSKSSKRKSKVATINLTNVSDVVDLFKSVSEETPDKRVTRRSLEQIMSENKQQNQSNSSKRKSKVARNNMTNVSGVADLFNSVSGETPAKMEQMSENKQENQSKSSKRKSKVATINLTNVSDVVDLVKSVSEETPDKRVTRRSLEQIMSENKQQNQSNSSKRKSKISCKRKVKVSNNDLTNVSGVAELFKLDSSPSRKITRKLVKEVINANNLSSSKMITKTPNNDLVIVSGVVELFKSDSDEVSSPSIKITRKSIKDIMINKNLSSSQKKTKMPTNDLTNVSGVGELFKSDSDVVSSPSKKITRKSVKDVMIVKNPISQKKTAIPHNDLTNVSGIDELFKSDFENYLTKKNIQSRQKMNKSPRNNSKLPINDLTNVSGIAELFKSNEILSIKKIPRKSMEVMNDNKKVGSSKRKTKMPYNDLSNVSGIAELFKSDSEEISPSKKSVNEISINENLNQSNSSKRKSVPEIESDEILQCNEQITTNNENKKNSSKRKSEMIEGDSNDALQSKKTKKETLKPETSPKENKNNFITILSPQLSKKYSSPPKTALDKSFDSLLGRSALKTYSRSPNKSRTSVGSPAQTESVVQWLNEQTDLENKDMFHVDKETGDFIANNVLVTVNNISEVVADLLTNKKHKTEPKLKKPVEKTTRTMRSRKVIDVNEDKIQEELKKVTRNKRNVSTKDEIIDVVDENEKTDTNRNKHKVKFVVENDDTIDLTSPVKTRRTARNRNAKLDDNEKKTVPEKITRTKRGILMSNVSEDRKNTKDNDTLKVSVPEKGRRTRNKKLTSEPDDIDNEVVVPREIKKTRSVVLSFVSKQVKRTRQQKLDDEIMNSSNKVPKNTKRTRNQKSTSELEENDAKQPNTVKDIPVKRTMRKRRLYTVDDAEIENLENVSIEVPKVNKKGGLRTKKSPYEDLQKLNCKKVKRGKKTADAEINEQTKNAVSEGRVTRSRMKNKI